MRQYLHLVIGGGALLRLLLLSVSTAHLGYYGGDAYRYMSISQQILDGTYNWAGLYPPLYPLMLALSLKLTQSPFLLSLLCIFLFYIFAFWLAQKIGKTFGSHWGIGAALFLSFDPIWLSQTIIVGADFIGAIIFGTSIAIILLESKMPYTKKRFLILGILMGLSALTKPVYVWIPFLLLGFFIKNKKFLILPALVFILGWFMVVFPYAKVRSQTTHQISLSGHNSTVFGRYIIGNIFVARGQTDDLYLAMDEAERIKNEKEKVNKEFTWNRYILTELTAQPKLSIKLFCISAYKTVFGNANLQLAKFFTGKDIEGPGLGTVLARQGSVFDKIKSINGLWLLGFFFEIIEKLTLLTLAGMGIKFLFKSRFSVAFSGLLIVLYFIFTPVVFGEPRYFLGATVVLLILAGYSQKVRQFRKG